MYFAYIVPRSYDPQPNWQPDWHKAWKLGDVGQDGLFLLWFNVMSESMLPSLTGKKLGSLDGDVGQDGLFIN